MIGKTISAGTFERPDRQLLGGIDSLRRQIMLKKSGSGISRRDFIKTTGAGALTAGLGPFPCFLNGRKWWVKLPFRNSRSNCEGSCFVLAMGAMTLREGPAPEGQPD
jgi:TAT (twin-arginine translocation) pathway signal sequence